MRRYVATLIFGLTILLSGVCLAGVSVSVAAESMVTGPTITLGDIAVIDGDEGERIAALRRISLGAAPLAGNRAVLSRDTLFARLSASQTPLTGIVWGPIPETITIIAGGQVLSGQTVADKVLASLKNSLRPGNGEEITVSLLQEVADSMVPLGTLSYELLAQPIRYGVPQTVYLVISADGVQVARIPVKCEFKRYTNVLTAAEPIGARQTLTAENVRSVRMDVSRLAAGYLTDPAAAVGLVVKRPLSAGTILYSSHVNKPLIVKRGAVVLITVNTGGIMVSTPGIAQGDGREGQTISVRNTATGRMISACVIDKDHVEVPIYEKKVR